MLIISIIVEHRDAAVKHIFLAPKPLKMSPPIYGTSSLRTLIQQKYNSNNVMITNKSRNVQRHLLIKT